MLRSFSMNATTSILVHNEADVRIIWQILHVIFWKRSTPRNILLYLFCSLEKLGLFHLKKSVIFLEIGSAMSSTQLACAHALLWSACECAATYQRMWSECLFPACCSNLDSDRSLGPLMFHVRFSKWPNMLAAEDYVIYEELGMRTKQRIVGFRGREEINFQDAGLFVCVLLFWPSDVMQSGTCYSWLSGL